nr:MAG TPA: hypothetical protein [Crassvirales sp.]
MFRLILLILIKTYIKLIIKTKLKFELLII